MCQDNLHIVGVFRLALESVEEKMLDLLR